jgi:oxygen-dependent protoporphyrinogen oxidase
VQVDVIVIGAGISGLAFAWKASKAGKQVLVLEASDRVGGCLRSERAPNDYWFELGAHTTYNSSGGFLEIAEGAGVLPRMIERGPARGSFGLLREGQYSWLTPPKVLLQLNWLEVMSHAPVGVFRSKAGKSVEQHFTGLIGPENFKRVLSPFFAAVPSQSADGFPAEGPGSLFKTRPRRKELPRSYGFQGGVQTVCDAAAQVKGVTTRTGVRCRRVEGSPGHFTVTTEAGEQHTAALVALSTPAPVSRALATGSFPALAAALSAIESVTVDSLGVVLAREDAWMPPCAFVVGAGEQFYSCVTRDPFPHPTLRSFTFHFKGGLSEADRLARAAEVLKVEPQKFVHRAHTQVTLPSPKADHAQTVARLDDAVRPTGLALCGNYFDGLAIEDCVSRSFAEWTRLSGALAPAAP